ncbi:alanine racemase family protein [Paecilomyces variotii No. 5]|uniref:Pyridoxal phosphate homeostasis protein n=1 Tax=Byssochlamys spectabilis (strain No. 5 / NBRC 109023) TaxID=1356009 RepID=V5FYX4_BYSSN|nr:alanine racemase family protein [Paecilomyces variotii No. 5]
MSAPSSTADSSSNVPPTTSSSNPTTTNIMPASPARISTLTSNFSAVTSRIASAASKSPSPRTSPVRLVAVSKLKPVSDILALYEEPVAQRHFGENYVQELLEKSRLLPADIKWHFIGGLQSNKCVGLARDVRGLWAVESVDTEKKASLLDKGRGERKKVQGQASSGEGEEEEKLRVFVQVNTSGEENKSGIEPAAASGLCRFIREKCPRLRLQGVMTIGAIARSKATTPENENEDFVCLKETRDRIVRELGLEGEDAKLELSMGMSEDFEGAITLGSDQVRVGTTIFGERPPKSEAKIV